MAVVAASVLVHGAGAATIDDDPSRVCSLQLAVGGCGGRLIAPHATIDDGRVDVCLIEAMTTVDFLARLKRVPGGEHADDRRVIYFQTAALELIFDRVIKVNTDGQVLVTDRCRYDVLPVRRGSSEGETSEIFQ